MYSIFVFFFKKYFAMQFLGCAFCCYEIFFMYDIRTLSWMRSKEKDWRKIFLSFFNKEFLGGFFEQKEFVVFGGEFRLWRVPLNRLVCLLGKSVNHEVRKVFLMPNTVLNLIARNWKMLSRQSYAFVNKQISNTLRVTEFCIYFIIKYNFIEWIK